LEHVVRRAVIMSDGPEIRPVDLDIQSDTVADTTIRQEVDHLKKIKVIEALRITDGNVTKAAQRLKLSRRQLHRVMKQNGIER
jgi:two-component system, NtrC family, response regulator